MSYVIPFATDTTILERSQPSEVLIRKVTDSQDARSELYEVREATSKVISPRRAKRAGSRFVGARIEPVQADRAATEHVGRLVRECREKSEALFEALPDPIQSALMGSSLVSLLQELWSYRTVREPDWVELLNVLQLILANQEFESLSREKRQALVGAFRDGLAFPTVGPSEVARTLEGLSGAGFDIWRGLEDFIPEH